MDGLSAAASGIAVVSVAVQLAESFKKLRDFWKSIKEAPEDIRAVSVDLEILSNVLIQIANETQHVEPDATLIAALNCCCVKAKTLTTILNEIEPGFASTSARVRKWTAFKAVLKRGELIKFQEALESLKGTLLLVQQNQYSRLSRIRQISLEQSLAAITHGVSSLGVQQHVEITEGIPSIATHNFRAQAQDATDHCAGNAYLVHGDPSNTDGSWSVPQKSAMVKRNLRQTRSVMEAFLGTLRATSTTYIQTSRQTGGLTADHEQDQYEHKTLYTIYPAQWLVRLGLQYGFHLSFLSSSTQGWKNTLKTFCPVPDDALIFDFCRQGNVPAVRKLLSGGHASVRDTDSKGFTPLHYAAQNYHPELCEILKSAGADTTTPTHNGRYIYGRTPVMLAAKDSTFTTHAILSNVFDTFRVLSDSMDFSEDDGVGWEVLYYLCESSCESGESYGDFEAKRSLLLLMLRMTSFELKTYIIERQYAGLLYWTLKPDLWSAEVSDLLLNLGGNSMIDAVQVVDGYTALHITVAFPEPDPSFLLARGANPHRRCFESCYTPYEESPTSLAMYSSQAFTLWLRALVDSEVDLEDFIDQELQQNVEVHLGWEKETLLELFKHGDRPDLHVTMRRKCSDCGGEIGIEVQPYWRDLIERIRTKRYPYDPAIASSETDEEESPDLGRVGEATGSSSEQSQTPNATRNDPLVNLDNELSSESESEDNTSESSAATTMGWDCKYEWDEIVCIYCWLHYKRTGTRRSRNKDPSETEGSLSGDGSSEDGYSPLLIHS